MNYSKPHYKVVVLGQVPANLIRKISEAHAEALKSTMKRRNKKTA